MLPETQQLWLWCKTIEAISLRRADDVLSATTVEASQPNGSFQRSGALKSDPNSRALVVYTDTCEKDLNQQKQPDDEPTSLIVRH